MQAPQNDDSQQMEIEDLIKVHGSITVLVDMDDTIANYSFSMAQALRERTGDESISRWNWSKRRDKDSALREHHERAQSQPSFFRKLNPIEGAFKALNEMESEGINVFIVSSPAIGNATCHSDKSAWLWEWFGERWSRKLVLTKDKTIVRGDVLIDDRPKVVGAMKPTWTHVLFRQPHNEHIDDGRLHLDGWENWREVLIKIFIDKR